MVILSNNSNFINTLIFAELIWITLYCLTILFGILNDDILLFSLSFFILGFAGLEFCIGFLLVILFRYFNKTLDFADFEKNTKNTNLNNKVTFVKKYTLL